MAGLFEIRQTRIDDHAGAPKLGEFLAQKLRDRGAWQETQRLYFEPYFARRQQQISGLYEFLRDPGDEKLAVSFATEWLTNFADLDEGIELELIDRLLTSVSGHGALKQILSDRRHLQTVGAERRRTWTAVGLIVDFETVSTALVSSDPIERELLWHIRASLGGRFSNRPTFHLDVRQLSWMISTFRLLWPMIERPNGVRNGDTNDWDACDYVGVLINRLGGQITEEAIDALTALTDAPEDGYTRHLRVTVALQKRKRVEANWKAPDLNAVIAAITDSAPTTPSQLQAIVLEELAVIQKKVRGSDLDWYRDFFSKPGVPCDEEECRDTILKMLDRPFGIQAAPEGHLADDKRCDIAFTLGDLFVPIEIKGQWHADLWTAADRQLDRLYTNDWRAERGIYLVIWFGRASAKPPTSTPRGVAPPQTAEELGDALRLRSKTVRQGRTDIVVLDLTRPA